MIFINALELINQCIEHNLLKEEDGKVFVYRNGTEKHKEGWYLTDKDILAKELMQDKEGQEILISALKEKNIEYTPTDFSWLSKFKFEVEE